MFTAASFTIAKIWKQPNIHTQTNKVVHTIDYYSAMERNKILPFVATWMDLEGITLSEISPTERDKVNMISLMWNLNKQNKQNKKTQRNIKLMALRGEGLGDERKGKR